jgi:hypothetical protein
MNLVSPQQRQTLENFSKKPSEQQAQQIADYCNKNGISKEQLSNILKMTKK